MLRSTIYAMKSLITAKPVSKSNRTLIVVLAVAFVGTLICLTWMAILGGTDYWSLERASRDLHDVFADAVELFTDNIEGILDTVEEIREDLHETPESAE